MFVIVRSNGEAVFDKNAETLAAFLGPDSLKKIKAAVEAHNNMR